MRSRFDPSALAWAQPKPCTGRIGEPGNGWQQVTSELAYERSGPERFLSAFRVLVAFTRAAGADPTPAEAAVIGRAAAHLMTLRRMSISVAGMLEDGKSPEVEAALVKALGNDFEKLLPEMVRLALPDGAMMDPAWEDFRRSYADTLLLSPSYDSAVRSPLPAMSSTRALPSDQPSRSTISWIIDCRLGVR